MSIIYSWEIDRMESYPEKDGYSNVVSIVHWRVNANEDDYIASNYGTSELIIDEKSEFVPYDKLNQETVIAWVKNKMGDDQISDIEYSLAEQIKNMINPPVVTYPLPWSEG